MKLLLAVGVEVVWEEERIEKAERAQYPDISAKVWSSSSEMALNFSFSCTSSSEREHLTVDKGWAELGGL